MPSEITITATIVAFVLIALTVSSVTLIINTALTMHQQTLSSLQKVERSLHQIIIVKSGVALNSTTIELNFTVLGVSIIPLTAAQIIVKYLDTDNVTVSYILSYGGKPGWIVDRIIVGNTTRNLSEGDYLSPGEVAELTLYLPTPASTLQPVYVTIVSPSGSKGEYSVGW